MTLYKIHLYRTGSLMKFRNFWLDKTARCDFLIRDPYIVKWNFIKKLMYLLIWWFAILLSDKKKNYAFIIQADLNILKVIKNFFGIRFFSVFTFVKIVYDIVVEIYAKLKNIFLSIFLRVHRRYIEMCCCCCWWRRGGNCDIFFSRGDMWATIQLIPSLSSREYFDIF